MWFVYSVVMIFSIKYHANRKMKRRLFALQLAQRLECVHGDFESQKAPPKATEVQLDPELVTIITGIKCYLEKKKLTVQHRQ